MVLQWCLVCCCNPGFILASVQLFYVFRRLPILLNFVPCKFPVCAKVPKCRPTVGAVFAWLSVSGRIIYILASETGRRTAEHV